MSKIKYQGGLTKLITSAIAKKNKRKFAVLISAPERLKALVENVNRKLNINMEVVSFSSSFDFSEQVLSILSFLKYAGIPSSWTIYSDGSHTAEQIRLIETAITFVQIVKMDLLNEAEVSGKIKESLRPWQTELLHYANNKALGKKLFYYLNHPVHSPTLFLDSDVLFYDKASVILDQLNYQNNGYFLPDIEWGTLDSRYIKNTPPQLYQVNGGFYIVNKEGLFINEALNYLKSLNGEYEYFTDQTAMHVLAITNNFIPLDPRIFILNSADQFDFSYLYDKSQMAVRHYTGPVRHKMWQKDWKWHLSPS